MFARKLFASQSVSEHLLRGAIGFAGLAFAYKLLSLPSMPALVGSAAFGVLALIAMRGCPTCWTVGLLNTSINRVCPLPSRTRKY
jgi:hypothetical protein